MQKELTPSQRIMHKIFEEILGHEIEYYCFKQDVFAECERYHGAIESVKVEAVWSPEYQIKIKDKPSLEEVSVSLEKVFEFLYLKILEHGK